MRFVNILGADAKPFGKQEYQMCFDKIQEKEIDNEIDNLLRLGVIKQVNFDKDQYISSIVVQYPK
jgi:hypothetical protein